nr:pyruvate, phosphate dikinase regulatory protein, chloroplastic [Tanacetum cinerariifolium]
LIPSNRPAIVEVPSELPKVNTSLQKLKRHLVGFDVVVKERTMATTITKGSWGFERIKACFRDEIIPFVKALKDLFNTFDQYFIDKLTESQEKDTIIKKPKERVKSLSGNVDKDKVKRDLDEIETINIELEHKVSKLVTENEHLKQTYKQLYDSIKPACIQSKEQCVALINQVNLKSVEISDLNVSFQEHTLVITTLKEELRNLKGKAVVENAITSPTIALKMYEIDVKPIASRLLHNRTVHSEYLRSTEEQAVTLREIVKQGKSQNPLNSSLDYACKYTKRIHELLIIIRQTCHSINKSNANLVVVNPKNKDKKVNFLRVNTTTSASGSQPTGSKKKDRISRTPSRSRKNKVEAHPRNVNSSLNKKICVVKSKWTSTVQQSKLNMNSNVTNEKPWNIINQVIALRRLPTYELCLAGSLTYELCLTGSWTYELCLAGSWFKSGTFVDFE